MLVSGWAERDWSKLTKAELMGCLAEAVVEVEGLLEVQQSDAAVCGEFMAKNRRLREEVAEAQRLANQAHADRVAADVRVDSLIRILDRPINVTVDAPREY